MNSSMISASVSMGALQQKLDLLADNIANANTVGYKRKTAVFEDILTNVNSHLKDFEQDGRRTPLGFTNGWGAKITSMQLDLSQGSLQETGSMTDAAIEGNVMFEVRPDGKIGGPPAYTRHGAFQLIPLQGGGRELVTNTGHPVVADNNGTPDFVTVPDVYDLSIAADGTLTATGPAGSTPLNLGKLKMAEVVRPELLQLSEDNLYVIPSDLLTSQPPVVRDPETEFAIRQGYLEQSNVDMTAEMTDLMMVQRAYQLSARALSSSNDMMGMANNLRG
ncbi:flagellar hook-basal body protein [Cohnella kolymensis]|uniref:Flagellar hook-basal body protein n=1 Tax=Cohnella kolymensis TaxID=1590652 RepID=A0ABR5A6R2_9BACL|nr:flagellar hook-basal body protein [Cohnella kolymensis]KIL36665.1 flagellar hook-basal body protein [Cohnella kolymensis]